MQFSIIAASLFASMAAALPTNEPTTTPTQCSNGGTVYCCTQDPAKIALLDLKILTCTVNNVLGNCNNQVCCVNAGSGSQTCSTTSGVNIAIPVTIGPLI
ncbi:hypothetical protein EJ05DRAFT_473144 [Pseudovirgaria hyperparasitica]|uniref:Hydrophobin n=1 Tax=Pseudovirgaria hyperparasitica TaxID=470096 RepID=A0A6A6WJV6_9PEZI|nr:uncharacterized protein EJ05DRAFT_473144 [Pseudovirgaria hyperparasitica]KAF2762227.1 hypothetical protein EJ05DRAFT_473144 [Pseudovirgaria hyperparasitica]